VHKKALAFGALFACFVLLSISSFAQSAPFAVGIRDACDPPTFNENVGKGTCIFGDHGRTKFRLFVKKLQQDQIAGAWYFSPLLNASAGKFRLITVNLTSGQATSLQNTGGELHPSPGYPEIRRRIYRVPQRFDRKP
jgi:hypothetical protein